MNHTDPQGMFFISCQRPSKVIRQVLPTQRKLVGLCFFFLSACMSSCRWSRALWARPTSDSVWLHLRVCGSQEPVGAVFIFINSLISVIITKHWLFDLFPPPRMCEYVDHLHEHFTSPVVIQDAHYMPPKARNWLGSQSALLWKNPQTFCCLQLLLFDFRIQAILVRCWRNLWTDMSTLKETYGNRK